ncbi:MAG: ATP synthase F0 subunit C [Nitrospirae bacterium]|nr:ATP synthase F0 subunit C [Nitrospirota bacterium]
MDYFKAIGVAAAIGIAIAAFGGALGQGKSVSSAVEGIARNPGASGKITITMVVGLAFIESLVIYALVVVLILFFGNPFKI